MSTILVLFGCIAIIFFIEYVYNSYLDTLPEDKRVEFLKRQTEMQCSCGSTDFEVVGMRHGKLKFQCKQCGKAR